MFAWNIVLIQATAELTCWWTDVRLHKWYYGYLRVSVASFRWTTARYASMIRYDVGQKGGRLIQHDITIFLPNLCIKINVFYTIRVFMDTCWQDFLYFVIYFFYPVIFLQENGGNKCIFFIKLEFYFFHITPHFTWKISSKLHFLFKL